MSCTKTPKPNSILVIHLSQKASTLETVCPLQFVDIRAAMQQKD